MGIFSWLRGKRPPARPPEHAVIVHFGFDGTDLAPLFELQHQLEEVLDEHELGEVDGNEVATDGSGGSLYMYGPDADALFAAARPVLESTPFMKGARVTLRYGPPDDGVKQREVVLGPGAS